MGEDKEDKGGGRGERKGKRGVRKEERGEGGVRSGGLDKDKRRGRLKGIDAWLHMRLPSMTFS